MNVVREYLGGQKRICEYPERNEDIRYEIQEYKTWKKYGEYITGWVTKGKANLLQCVMLIECGKRVR